MFALILHRTDFCERRLAELEVRNMVTEISGTVRLTAALGLPDLAPRVTWQPQPQPAAAPGCGPPAGWRFGMDLGS